MKGNFLQPRVPFELDDWDDIQPQGLFLPLAYSTISLTYQPTITCNGKQVELEELGRDQELTQEPNTRGQKRMQMQILPCKEVLKNRDNLQQKWETLSLVPML